MKKKISPIYVLIATVSAVIIYLLANTSSFALAYREQQQLFMYDFPYICETLLRPGGFATLAGLFIVQFFFSRTAAVIITAVLAASCSFTIWRIIKKMHSGIWSEALCVIPSFLMAASATDNFLHFEYMVALLMATAFLFIYISAKKLHTLLGIGLTALLYALAGSAATVFALSAMAYDCFSGNKTRALACIILPLTSLGLSAAALYSGQVATFQAGAGAAFFFEVTEKSPLLHTITWLSIPFTIAFASILHLIPLEIARICISTILTVSAAIYSGQAATKILKSKNLAAFRYEYYVQNNMWRELEEFAVKNIGRYEDANYYNLAKSRLGTLSDELLKANHHGPFNLIHIPDAQSADTRLAYVLYEMGNMAAAENVAFNGLRSLCGFKPAMVKICVDVEIMRGKKDLAEKYNRLLLKSLHYRNWAKERQILIESDDPAALDAEIARGMKDLPEQDGFIIDPSPLTDLYRILDTNPSDRKAFDYALGLIILSKDYNGVFDFVERYYSSEKLGPLGLPAQEALVFLWDYYANADHNLLLSRGMSMDEIDRYMKADKQWCLDHGVTQETFDRFASFKSAYAKSRGAEIKSQKQTFWSFILFNRN